MSGPLDQTALLGVICGGALGAVARFSLQRLWVSQFVEGRDRFHGWAPVAATLTANSIGCLALGDWLGRDALELGAFDDFYVAGLCGGLTTFSTLCGEILRITRSAGPGFGAAYVLATIATGFGAFWMGLGAGL